MIQPTVLFSLNEMEKHEIKKFLSSWKDITISLASIYALGTLNLVYVGHSSLDQKAEYVGGVGVGYLYMMIFSMICSIGSGILFNVRISRIIGQFSKNQELLNKYLIKQFAFQFKTLLILFIWFIIASLLSRYVLGILIKDEITLTAASEYVAFNIPTQMFYAIYETMKYFLISFEKNDRVRTNCLIAVLFHGSVGCFFFIYMSSGFYTVIILFSCTHFLNMMLYIYSIKTDEDINFIYYEILPVALSQLFCKKKKKKMTNDVELSAPSPTLSTNLLNIPKEEPTLKQTSSITLKENFSSYFIQSINFIFGLIFLSMGYEIMTFLISLLNDPDALAAQSNLSSFIVLFNMIPIGLSIGLTSKLSECIGLKNERLAIVIASTAFIIIILLSFTFSVVFYFFGNQIALMMFNSQAVAQDFMQGLQIYFLISFFDYFQLVFSNGLRSLNQEIFAMKTTLILQDFFGIPLMIFFQQYYFHDLRGVWVGYLICVVMVFIAQMTKLFTLDREELFALSSPYNELASKRPSSIHRFQAQQNFISS